MEPTKFGPYVLLRRLAVGGMAEIYLARTARLDGFEKILVIKRIRRDLDQDERYYSMFIDEARITINFAHPAVVQTFDFGRIDESYFLAMEYILGCDARTLFKLDEIQENGIDPGLGMLIIEEALHGLGYAHNFVDESGKLANIVHRDVSPANILLSFHGAVKVADFGIARAQGKLSKTKPGMVMGKLAYMAPEHAQGEAVDQRTDVFSCGVVLWELLTGKRVHGGYSGMDLVGRVRDGSIDPPSAVRPGIVPEIDEIVLRACAASPDKRFATAREMAETLRRYRTKHFPETSLYTLQAYLDQHREALSVESKSPQTAVTGSTMALGTATAPPRHGTVEKYTDGIEDAVKQFQSRPSLWVLAKIGRVFARQKEKAEADTILRATAILFARNGLLAAALLCSRARLRLRKFESIQQELAQLPEVSKLDSKGVDTLMFQGAERAVRLLHRLLDKAPRINSGSQPSAPLLSYLGGEAFAMLAKEAKPRRIKAGEAIVKQGDRGDTMFLIAEGRALVHATGKDGNRIYLASLGSGDFFGENSFFTGARRSATVEADYRVDAFEIDRALYDRIMRNDKNASSVLLRFYKERIVETVIAKSAVFGVLSAEDRRAMVERFRLRRFNKGETIIREGAQSDQIYLIKQGAAEVFSEKTGEYVHLSDLGPDTLFGEIAALRDVPRTASVRAKARVDALELSGARFRELLVDKPEVLAVVRKIVAERVRDKHDKLNP